MRSTDGVTLAIHTFEGPPAAPLLVWSHANGFCTQSYEPFLSAMSASVRVIGLDMRGHGLSGQPPQPFENSLSLDRMTADYRELLASIRALYPGAPLIGAGHSMGALMPLMAAAKGEPLDRLVLVEPAVFPPSGHPAHEEARALTADRMESIPRRRAVFAAPEELQRSLQRVPAFASMSPQHLLEHCVNVLCKHDDGNYELRCPPTVEGFLYGEIARFDKYEDLRRFALPVLLVGADPEHPGSTWVSRTQPYLCDTIAGSRLDVLPDAGHLAPLQVPVKTAQLVEQWIRS